MSSNGESKDVGIRSRCCTYVSSKSQKKQTSENQNKNFGTWYHAVVCRLTLCEAVSRIEFGSIDPNERLIMSESIDETAGTPSVLLAAVTLSMRQQVHPLFRWPQLSRTAARLLCVLGGLPRNWQGSARWYQVHPYASTYPTLKPRLFERSESHTETKIIRIKKKLRTSYGARSRQYSCSPLLPASSS